MNESITRRGFVAGAAAATVACAAGVGAAVADEAQTAWDDEADIVEQEVRGWR